MPENTDYKASKSHNQPIAYKERLNSWAIARLLPNTQREIVALGQTDQMYAVVEVYQSDIKKVRPGQDVRVSSDSLGNELEGRVDWIGMQVKRQNLINADPSSNIDARVVEVHVQLNKLSSQNASSLTNLQVKAVIEL